MQTKQALYRVWRSKKFSELVGQQAIVTTLRNQIITGRISHAYLFSGSRGTGKTSTAKIFAKAVNCNAPEDGEPCGHCASCEAFAQETNLDVLEMDAASNRKVEDARDLLERVKYPPQLGRRRVYIIDEAHMLTREAFDTLLKTLEEPPSHALFILATTAPERMPATILSRCQRYAFRRIEASIIVDRLALVTHTMEIDAESEALWILARAAEGGMRDALSMLDMCLSYGDMSLTASTVREVLGLADPESLFQFADAFSRGDTASALTGVDAALRQGAEPQRFARDVSEHLRALLLAQVCGDALAATLAVTEDTAVRYRTQTKDFSRENILRVLDLFLAAEHDMKWSSQPRTALEVAAARACLPEESVQLDTLAARLDLLERRPAPEPKPKPVPVPISNPLLVPPPSTPPPTTVDTHDLWKKTIDTLMKVKVSLASPLRQGTFLGVTGDVARFAFKPEAAIYRSIVDKPDSLALLSQVLSEHAGQPLRFEIIEYTKPKSANPLAQDIIQDVIDCFGREHVEIVDAL